MPNPFDRIKFYFTKLLLSGCCSIILLGCANHNDDNQDCSQLPCDDQDGDGLSDQDELNGWSIYLDTAALGPNANLELYTMKTVTSDPYNPDTDNDGVNDSIEFDDRTDPRNADTDGDQLSDYAEKYRWRTNGRSVDSDGDARGPLGDLAANPALYDGAEIAQGSSPSLKDTDGDGLDDYTESILRPNRHPLIAELPHAMLNFDTPIQLHWSVTYAQTPDESTTYGNTFSQHSTHSSAKIDLISTLAIMAKPKNSRFINQPLLLIDGTPLPASLVNTHRNKPLTPDLISTVATTFTPEALLEIKAQYLRYQQQARFDTEINTRAEINLPVTIINTGQMSFTLTALSIAIMHWHYATDKPHPAILATLQSNIIDPITLAPNERVVVPAQADFVDTTVLKNLLANPTTLFYYPLQYTITNTNSIDASDIDFTAMQQNVNQKTARLIIDYGNGLVERYRIATNVNRFASTTPNPANANQPFRPGDFTGINLPQVFKQILDIPYTLSPQSIQQNGIHQTINRLTSIKSIKNKFTDTLSQAHWIIATPQDTQTHFQHLSLQHSDQVHLIYLQDNDGDTLYQRHEYLLNAKDEFVDQWLPAAANDNAPILDIIYADYPVALVDGKVMQTSGTDGISDSIDTDQDGLTDAEEYYLGWEVSIDDQTSYRVFSNLTAIDTDQDGLTDYQEKDLGTDPNQFDTDADTLADGCETAPLTTTTTTLITQNILPQCRLSLAYLTVNHDTNNRSSIAAYAVLPGATQWIEIDNSPFHSTSGPTAALAIRPQGDFLYSTDNFNQRITAYPINAKTGALSANIMQHDPSAPNNHDYRQMLIDPTGQFIFVHDASNQSIASFQIPLTPQSPTDESLGGSLHWLANYQPHSVIQAMAIDPQGYFLYTQGWSRPSDANHHSTQYEIIATPILTQDRQTTSTPFKITINDQTNIEFTALTTGPLNATHVVYVTTSTTLYAFQSISKTPNTTPEWQQYSMNTGLSHPTSIAADPTGQFVYVAHEHGIKGFATKKIQSEESRLPEIASISKPENNLIKLIIPPTGHYLYTHTGVFQIHTRTGQLTPINPKHFPNISNDMAILQI